MAPHNVKGSGQAGDLVVEESGGRRLAAPAAPSNSLQTGISGAEVTSRTASQKPGRGRRAAVFLVVFLLVAGGLAGLVIWKIVRVQTAIQAHSFEPPPIEVAAMKVVSTRASNSLDSIGTLRAIRTVNLAPEVAGRVVSIDFDAGQQVGKGDRLIQLDERLEQAELKAAVATANYARQQLDRSRTLAATRAGSRQTLDQRLSEFDQAQAAVEQLRTRIDQKAVVAPFDGFLGLRRVNLGEYIGAGTEVVTLTQLDALYVNFAVPQQDLSKLRPGGRGVVRSDAFPGEEFPATITAIDPVVDTDTRNVTIQATMQNPGNRMRPGLFVTVSVALPDRDDVILVPATAVQTGASGDTAFLVRNGKAEIVPVRTGARLGEEVIVEEGLSRGDIIITRGQLRVYPGASVAVAPELAGNESAGEGQ